MALVGRKGNFVVLKEIDLPQQNTKSLLWNIRPSERQFNRWAVSA